MEEKKKKKPIKKNDKDRHKNIKQVGPTGLSCHPPPSQPFRLPVADEYVGNLW